MIYYAYMYPTWNRLQIIPCADFYGHASLKVCQNKVLHIRFLLLPRKYDKPVWNGNLAQYDADSSFEKKKKYEMEIFLQCATCLASWKDYFTRLLQNNST